MTSKQAGFTLIELLVVIVIIGILATLATVAVSSVRIRARDAKRISDIKQIQTALELFFSDESGYPTTGAVTPGSPLTSSDGSKTYMKTVPSNPQPRTEGACASAGDYSYSQVNFGQSYSLSYCLAKEVSGLPAGIAAATPKSINNACTPNCGGKYCGDDNGCGGTCTALQANADTCTAGVPKCGAAAACSGTTDTCTAGVCKCGSGAACSGGLSCSAGTCVVAECGASVCGDGTSLSCGAVDFTANGSLTLNSTNASAYETATTYQAVKVGSQCWMDKNINIGTVSPVANTVNVYPLTDGIKRSCDGDVVSGCNTNNNGGIYSWVMAMYLPSSYVNSQFTGYTGSGASAKRQGICPVGWHIPSDRELATLVDYLDSSSIPPTGTGSTCGSYYGYFANTLCSTAPAPYNGSAWYGTDSTAGAGYKLMAGRSSGLNLPSPGYVSSGTFQAVGDDNRVWTSSQSSVNNVWFFYWRAVLNQTLHANVDKMTGFSVRCIKD